ncbi:Polyketide synthase [Aphelenchoides bicaudatus]|nr:Polyketide synthase [Aphelenchoides bicaudatus]
MNETGAIERTIGFMELGLDSFGMFNLSNQINRIYEQNLVNIIHLFEHSTIETLSIFIQQKLQNSSPIIQHSNDQNASSSAINNNTQQKETQSNKIENSKKDSEKQEKTSKPTNKAKATVSFSKPLKRPNLLFLFGGNGSLYSGVCADLIAKVPFVEQQVNICSQHFQEHLKTTSVADIIKQSKTDEIKCLPVEHAVIFTIGYTLAKFWLHVNLEPTHLIGHSLGEIIAICIAGRLELVDAVHLVYLRAKGFGKV